MELARQLIADGRLGAVEHVAIRLLADYAAHPDAGLTWRFSERLGRVPACWATWSVTGSTSAATSSANSTD